MKDIKVFFKKKKKKKDNMVVNESTKRWKKSFFSTEKSIINWEKTPYYNYKKLLFLKNESKRSFDGEEIKAKYQEVFLESYLKQKCTLKSCLD